MKTNKFYFLDEDSTEAYQESYFQQYMEQEGLTEIMVIEGIKSKDTDFIYCTIFGVGEKSECGKHVCDHYKSDGQNKRCEHKGTYLEYGEEVKLTLNTKRNEKNYKN